MPVGIELDPDIKYTKKEWVETFIPSKIQTNINGMGDLYDFDTELNYLIAEPSRIIEAVMSVLHYIGPLRSYPSRDSVSKNTRIPTGSQAADTLGTSLKRTPKFEKK